jgi:hypothetical protein
MSAATVPHPRPGSCLANSTRGAAAPDWIEDISQYERSLQEGPLPVGRPDRDADPPLEEGPRSFTSVSSGGTTIDPGAFHGPKKPKPCLASIRKLPRARVIPWHRREAAQQLRGQAAQRHPGPGPACCSVCLGDLVGGGGGSGGGGGGATFGMLTRLPCGHKYHYLCCLRWIQDNPTCPECRYELPLEDPLLEAERSERMKGRAVVTCSCRPGLHECFFSENATVEAGK